MSMILRVCLLAFLVGSSVLAQESDSVGETWYVTDKLRLSLYEQPDSRSKVSQLLGSGDKLLIDEVSGLYAKVTTASGKHGWVKRGFLVSDPTSNLRLIELTQSHERLKQELETLNDSKVVIKQYEIDMDGLTEKIGTLENEKNDAHKTIADLEQVAEAKRQQEQAKPALASLISIGKIYWKYMVLGVLVLILVGYVLGKLATQASIKKKFHGIKVW